VRARATDGAERATRFVQDVLLPPHRPGGRPRKENYPGGGTVSRTSAGAARAAGISKRFKDTALRVASIPKELFEQLIESDNPPNVTALAALGTRRRATPVAPGKPTKSVCRAIDELWKFSQDDGSSLIVRKLSPDIQGKLAAIVSWALALEKSA
jgi:hypothetical protein